MPYDNEQRSSKPTDSIARSEGTRQSAVDLADRMRKANEMLSRTKKEKARVQEVLKTQETNMIFAVDATASREFFWRETIKVQDKMFDAVQKSGANLFAQLVSYSGETHDGELHRTPWYNNAYALSEHLRSVRCSTSGTQIEKVFRYALKECCSKPIHALLFVGDSYEENVPTLLHFARQLKQKNIKLFMFHDTRKQEYHVPEDTQAVYKEIAKTAEGLYVPFNIENMAQLGDFLKGAGGLATQNETVIAYTRAIMETPEGRDMIDKGTHQLALSQANGPK